MKKEKAQKISINILYIILYTVILILEKEFKVTSQHRLHLKHV